MPSASVTVTNPTGSSRWYRGQSYNITWSHTTGLGQSVDHFEVRLYKGSSLDTVITTNDNASPKSWTVPSDQTEGTDYRIQVKMVLTGGGEISYTDYSGYFDIHEKYHTNSLSDTATSSDTFATPSLDTWRFTESLTDTSTLTETFATPSLDTWRFVKSLTDTGTLSETFTTPSVFTYLTSNSLTDTGTLTETLSASTDTWRFIKTLSDSATLSESLASSTYTYLTNRSLSDTATMSDTFATPSLDLWRHVNSLSDSATLTETFATPVLDTWFHRINIADTATLSESLASSTYTYLTTRSLSDTGTLSDSLGVTTDFWKIINSLSDTATSSENFNASLSFWREERTNSDTATTSDSFTAQLVVDTDTYYYDTISLSNATKTVGYVASIGGWVTSSSLVTQVDGLTDGQIAEPAIFSASGRAGVRFDLGSQKEVDFFCIHLQSGETEEIKLYGSNSQGTGYSLLITASNGDNTWTINELSSTVNYRYYVVQCEATTVSTKIDEVIIGKKFKPEVRESLGGSVKFNSQVVKTSSFKGNEYVYRKGNGKYSIEKRYDNISLTLKNELETLRNKVDSKKFLYFNDKLPENINYCRIEPFAVNEIAHQRYATNFILQTL